MVLVYLNSSKKLYFATAEYDEHGIKLLKGSRIDLSSERSSIKDNMRKLRHNQKIVDAEGVVLEDISFATPSAAAVFVLGYSENGNRCWKTADGKSIGELKLANVQPVKVPATHPVDPTVIKEAKIQNGQKVKTPFARLRSRILREIRRKKFLGDILINDEEYAILVDYIHHQLSSAYAQTLLQGSDVCIATGLVQVGIRFYDGNFWSHAADAFSVPELKKAYGLRTQVSNVFQSTLIKYGKPFTGVSETVQNILMHGFVSNYYADQYFDFLYAFYRLDLGRNINLMDTATIRALFDSIANSSSARTWMLREQVRDAIIANPIGCKIRLRRHLQLIDNFFWNENYRLHTNNRIYSLLQAWVDKNNRFETERAETGIHRRGKKAFSKPHFLANYQQETFQLYLPAQLLPRDMQTEVTTQISVGNYTKAISADIVETVTAYRTEPVTISIPANYLLEEVSVSLVAGGDTVIRKFQIPAENVRFFDEEGYSENLSGLKNGVYFAYTKPQVQLSSTAIVDHRMLGALQQWYLDLQDGDLIQLPSGTAVFVGRTNTEGILGRGRLNTARAIYPDNPQESLPIYAVMPEVVIRAPLEKSDGILLVVNGTRHRVSAENAQRFSYDDGTTDVGYSIRLAQVVPIVNGRYDIHIDVPNGAKRWYSFLLMVELKVAFDGAPYIFEPRGSVALTCSETVTALDANCERSGKGQFDFEIQADQRELSFRIDLPDAPVLKTRVPALFWRYDDGAWHWEQSEELWHKELPGIIEIVAPCEKAVLHIDDLQDEETELEQKPIVGEKRADREGLVFDTTRLKTYLEADQALRTLYLDMDEVTKRFVQIVTRSTVVQCTAYGHFETRQISVKALVIGKADYYVDVSLGNNIVAEKAPLVDGDCLLDIPEGLSTGEYEIELFEGEQDDFGFGDSYKSLGIYRQKLVNPYDMRGANLELVQLHREDGKKSPLLMTFTAVDLQYISGKNTNFYGAQMIVSEKEKPVATYPVIVEFIDYSTPDRARLYFDDDGEDTEFLYDAVRRIIVKQEDEGISRAEKYRRFEVLYGDDVFEVRFTERIPANVTVLPDHIPTWSSQGKGASIIRGVTWKQHDVQSGRQMPIQTRHPVGFRESQKAKPFVPTAQSQHCTADSGIVVIHDATAAPTVAEADDIYKPVPVETAASVHAIKESGLPPLIYNKCKKAGLNTLESVAHLYASKGMKGISNINGCSKSDAEKIVFCLRQYNLI